MCTTAPVLLLVVLSPPLLAELAARLAPSELVVVVAAEGAPVPAGHYDVVVRNVSLPAGVTADVVVDLPAPAGPAPATGTPTAGEVVALDRLEDVAALLAARWPSAS